MSPVDGPALVSGVVLAAGSSTRLAGSRPKQLLELGGKPLIRRVVLSALESGLHEVVVVLGHAAAEVGEAIPDLDCRIVENPDYRIGQSTSVRHGLAAIAPESRATMFIPADQPLLSTALIDRLVESYRATAGPIVIPTHKGRRGAPVVFDRSLFFELEKLEGDAGGRSILPRYRSEIVEVSVANPRELADVDTAADLEQLRDELQEAVSDPKR